MLDASCLPTVQTVTKVFRLVFPLPYLSDMKTVLTLCSQESVVRMIKGWVLGGYEHVYVYR